MTVETYSDRYFLDVVKIVENFHREAVHEYDDLFNADTLIETIKSAKAENAANCFLLIVDGTCQGMLYGTRFKSLLNDRIIFQEAIWYVNVAYRSRGVKLLNDVEKILKSQGVSIMIMALLENSKAEKLKQLYARMGYKPMETHFVRSL